MQMRNQRMQNSKMKKSQLLLIGSFLVFVGIGLFSFNYLLKIKDAIYSDMKIAMSDVDAPEKEQVVENVPSVNNVVENHTPEQKKDVPINYDKYFGVLEIPKIGLKRGFYNIDSKYNDIQYNVSLVHGSSMPDVANGNLILMAHSGDAYISYFAYLYRLNVGDYAYITYHGVRYQYRIVNIYNVSKNGTVKIIRNYNRTTLTLVTCTKNNDTMQTVYIAELV